MEHDKRHSYGHLGMRIFLLIAGIALMMDKFDIFYAGQVWHYWPIIIIAVGLGKMLDAQEAWEYGKAFMGPFLWIMVLYISELHIFGLDYHIHGRYYSSDRNGRVLEIC